jgi:hypothetical protein
LRKTAWLSHAVYYNFDYNVLALVHAGNKRDTVISKISCILNIPCISKKKKTKSEKEREGNFSSLESLARKSCD